MRLSAACQTHCAALTLRSCFRIISSFRPISEKIAFGRGDLNIKMSYAVIKTGGKQFAVAEGQTVRVPSLEGKEGSKVDIQALVVGEGKSATIGGDATISATVVGHGKDDKIIVFKKKRRKQYKRKQGHRQGFTEIKIEKI